MSVERRAGEEPRAEKGSPRALADAQAQALVSELAALALPPLEPMDFWLLAKELEPRLYEQSLAGALAELCSRSLDEIWSAELRLWCVALLTGARRGEPLSVTLERCGQLVDPDLAYAVFVGEACALLPDALSWYVSGLWSSKPPELRRLDLMDLYFKIGVSLSEFATSDPYVQETPWLKEQLRLLQAVCPVVSQEVFDAWRRGEVTVGDGVYGWG